MRIKPGSHIEIVIAPYTPKFTARNKHGSTHLLRVIEREVTLDKTGAGGASHDGSREPYNGGKILNIFEQQITSGEDNAGIARALRRHGEWMKPNVPRKKSGVGARLRGFAKAAREQKITVTCGGQGTEHLP